VPHEEIASRAGTIVTSATWSSDGGEIVYVRGDSLLARRPATGVTRLITTGADLHSCSWAPNVAVLACVAGNSFFVTVGRIFGLGPMFGNLAPSRIVLIQAASGAMTSVTDSVFLHQSPEWAPDGRTLYYVSNRQGTRDVYALPMTTRGQPDGPSVRMDRVCRLPQHRERVGDVDSGQAARSSGVRRSGDIRQSDGGRRPHFRRSEMAHL
jgi:TolB protein